METKKNIPISNFAERQRKDFEFEIITNKQLLLHDLPKDYNPFRPHRLHYYAILFIREGEGKHFVDFKQYDYQSGTIIFIAKGQVHAFEANINRRATFLLFTQSFLEKSSLGSNLMQQLSLYNYNINHPILNLEKENFEVFSTLVNQIETEYHAPDDYATEEIIQSALKMFLLLADRIRKINISQNHNLAYRKEFLQFQNLLNEHLFETRRVQFYANEMQISTKKLNMITQEMVHLPAKNYINEQLILEIKRFLMNTGLSVKEIAYESGFEEPTNFVKFFKKYAGMTPVAFRKGF